MIYETNFTERDNEFIDALFEHIDNNPVKSKEEIKMKEIKRPYNAETLTKWSAFRVDPAPFTDKGFALVKVPLTTLVKHPSYTQFRDRFNWLYKNYSHENYDIVWKELQDYNESRKEMLIQEDTLRRSEYSAKFQLEELEIHFGEIPEYVLNLTEEQHAARLEWARLKYDIEPDYEICKLYLKDIYTVPERELMDDYQGIPIYHEIKPEELKAPHAYNTIVGKAVVISDYVRKLAEQAAIRDALWMKENCPEFATPGTMDDLRNYSEWERTHGIPEQDRAWQLSQEINVKTYKR